MNLTHITPILNVADVPASIHWFEKLGWKRGFTYNDGGMIQNATDRNEHGPAQFGAVCAGESEIFLCKDGQGSRVGPTPRHYKPEPDAEGDNTGGVWMSWWLKTPVEVDSLHALAVKNGCEIAWPPTNEPWGVREFHLRHPDGHTFRISAQLNQH